MALFKYNKVRQILWRRGLIESTIVIVLYAAYSLTQGSLGHSEMVAIQNSYALVSLEKLIKIFWEPSIQSWFLKNILLVHTMDAIYTYLFYPVLISFAFWTYNHHRQEYRFARNIFLVSTVIGLICFALFPVAPPRLLPGLGFSDTLTKFEELNYSSSTPLVFVNQYAAMPSFHFGWTLLVGMSTFFMVRVTWLKVLGIALPVMMFISIIATGNHFVLDAVGGGIVILLSYGLVRLGTKLWSKITT